MKITLKELKELIKEEIETQETPEQAYRANLDDEKIIRFFEEGLDQDELTEEQLSEVEGLDEAAVVAMIPRVISAMTRSKMISTVLQKIKEDPKAAMQFMAAMANMLGVSTDQFAGKQRSIAKSMGDDEPSSGALEESLVREVVEEILNSKK
jgi:hypothetical protein